MYTVEVKHCADLIRVADYVNFPELSMEITAIIALSNYFTIELCWCDPLGRRARKPTVTRDESSWGRETSGRGASRDRFPTTEIQELRKTK